jgi:hypothetical protein
MYKVHEALNKEKETITLQLMNDGEVIRQFDFEVSTERPHDRKVLRQMLDRECKSRNRKDRTKSSAQ